MPLGWAIKTLGLVAFTAIPLLAILSYRGWVKRLRKGLPQWRSSLGLTSIVLSFLGWSASTVLLLLGSSSDNWIQALAILALTGTVLGFAFRGASRIEAIAAGLLLFAGLTSAVY